MQESIYGLVREVERIVTAPYAPVLNKLEYIVENASQTVLFRWAACKPCQVSLLAAVFLEQLPYSLKLLAKFGSTREFRDALLQQEPALLDHLLKRAIEEGDAEHLNACISILSSRVSEETAVPARIPHFLTTLLQKMVQKPCARTIRPLYEVVEGLIGSPNILNILPDDLMATFQLEATRILRSLNDPMASLLCLATFARIRKLWQLTKNGSYMPTWLENIFQILGPKRAAKTLDLVLISAIMACSSSCNGYAPEERVLLVKLAIEICQDFDEELKKAWLSTNKPKVVKMCEKLRRPEIDPELQMMGLTLLTTFSQWLSLPQEIYSMTRERLFAGSESDVLYQLPESAQEALLQSLLDNLDASEVPKILSCTISSLQQSKEVAISEIDAVRVNLLALSAIKKSESHSSAVFSYLERLSAADELALRNHTQKLSSNQIDCPCETLPVCAAALRMGKDRVFLELLSCLHSSAVGRNGGASLKVHHLTLSFLDRLKEPSGNRNSCRFSRSTAPERLGSLCQQPRPPVTTIRVGGSSHEWRSKLAASLLENAQASHQTIIRQMEAICGDFESRCANIEEPLAAMTKERDELKRRLEEAQEINMELENRALQSSEMISSLKAEREQMVEKSRNYSLEVEHLAEQVDSLQNELDSAREEWKHSIDAERTKARTRELDLMATVTERDDLLEEQETEMDKLKRENAHLKEILNSTSERNKELLQERDALHDEVSKIQKQVAYGRDNFEMEIARLHQLMNIRESTNAERDNHIMALTDANLSLSVEIKNLTERIDQEKSNAETLRSAAEEERRRHRSEIMELERKHAVQIAQSLQEGQNKIDRYRNEITAIQNRAETKISKAEKDLRTKDKRIQHLEKKVEALRNERSAKAREFAEAQEHIGRLMNVMGFSKDQKNDNQKAGARNRSKESRRSSRLAELQTQSFRPSEGETTMYTTQFSVMQQTHLSAEPLQHSAHRRSRRMSDADSQDPNRSFSPSKKESTVREREPLRQPLGNIDKNSPTKSSQQGSCDVAGYEDQKNSRTSQSQGDYDVAEWGDVDLDFDNDDVFTSTGAR